MVTNNAVNLKSTGITGYNGAGTFTATAVSAHNVLVGGSTSDTIVNVPPSATVGFVLTSNGTGADPSFQSVSPGASVTFTGDTGTPFSTSSVTIFSNNAGNNSGSSVSFDATSPNMTLNVTDGNSNVLIGNAAGNATVSGTQNVGLGQSCLSSLSSGNSNTCLGAVSGNALLTGSGNILVGNSAGQDYNGAESSNIVIGINTAGRGESNVIRIGGGTGTGSFQQNSVFFSGITGSTPIDANSPQVIVCDNTDNITVIPDTTAGFVLTSNSPNSPTFQAHSNAIPFTNTGSPLTAVANNGYYITTSTTITLPASPPQGSFVIIMTENTEIVTITANTGQTIRLVNSVSASGGTAVNTLGGDSITLYYKANSSQWAAGSVIGSWTIT